MMRTFSDLRYEASDEIISNIASCNFLSAFDMFSRIPLSTTSGRSDHNDLCPAFDISSSWTELLESSFFTCVASLYLLLCDIPVTTPTTPTPTTPTTVRFLIKF